MSKAIDYINSMLNDINNQEGRWTREQSEGWGSEYWAISQDKTLTEAERRAKLAEHDGRYCLPTNVRVNERGNTIVSRNLRADRYFFDSDGAFARDWKQFDTNQDASYFGFWVNPTKLMTLTYGEGDVSLVICPDSAHYNAEVLDACKFYREGFEAISCDTEGFMSIMLGNTPAGEVSVYRQDRSQFLIKEPEAQAG